MTYVAPILEQQFLLRHVAGLPDLVGHEHYPALDDSLIDAIVHGAAVFAEGEFAPLSRVGDTVGAKWADGVVTMPEGFRKAYQSFVQNGWGAISGPEQYGGQGLPFALTTVVAEDLCAANAGFSLIALLTLGAVEAIHAHGSPEQKATWLPKLITGEWPGTMNLTEPQAGSDVGALRTSATPAGDGLYRIKGQKIFITYGEHDLAGNIVHLVLARTPDAPLGTKGISLFLVPKYRLDKAGKPTIANDVRCTSIEHKLGIHASPTCVMSYGDNDGCLGELIGPENGGMRAMFTMMNNARINIGNQGLQVAERACQQALAYACDRIQSPRADGSSGALPVAIVEHPDVRRMLMRMKALTQAGRALLYYTAGQVDRAHIGDTAAQVRQDLMTPLVKAFCSDIGCEVASLGVQVHGGMGFIEETGAAQHYRDARIVPIYEGTNGIQAADLVGRKLMGDKGAGLRTLLADVREEAADEPMLMALADAVDGIAQWMLSTTVNDRLAGSYPFLTMVSVLAAGWLMARQERIARAGAAAEQGNASFLKMKSVVARYFLDQIVPEASGLRAAALGGAGLLYALASDELLA